MSNKAYGLTLMGEYLGIKDTQKAETKIVRIDDGDKTYEVFVDIKKISDIKNLSKGKEIIMKVSPSLRIYNNAPALSWNCREMLNK